jgi:Amt family ammonium transporter
MILGPRKGFGVKSMKPHNIVYSVIGASLLWVGWFGFNAGSAVRAGPAAGFAMMVTQICAAAGGFSWMLVEWVHTGKPSVIGIVRLEGRQTLAATCFVEVNGEMPWLLPHSGPLGSL